MKAMTLRMLAVLILVTSFGAIGCSHDHDDHDHDRRGDRDYHSGDYRDRNSDHGGDRR